MSLFTALATPECGCVSLNSETTSSYTQHTYHFVAVSAEKRHSMKPINANSDALDWVSTKA